MKDLMLLMSDVMPEELIISMLKEAIAEHEITNNEESRGKVAMLCMMFASKDACSKAPGGVEEMMRKSEEMDEARRLFPLKKN